MLRCRSGIVLRPIWRGAITPSETKSAWRPASTLLRNETAVARLPELQSRHCAEVIGRQRCGCSFLVRARHANHTTLRSFSSSSTTISATTPIIQQHEKWDTEIDNLLAQGSISEAQDLLVLALQENSGKAVPDEDFALRTRKKLFDAWIRHQESLLKLLDRNPKQRSSIVSVSSAESANTEEKQLQDRQKLEYRICEAANQAHSLLEEMEPFLGARNVWLDTRNAIDDDDVEYHGKILDEEDDALTNAVHSSNDELLHRCNTLLTAWAKAVRASHHRANSGIPQRATFLLERMEASSSSLSLDETNTAPISVQPTLESYNRVLESWAYSREHLRGATAQRIWNRMQSKSKQQKKYVADVTRPNGESHRLVLWAWAQSPYEENSAFRATGHLMKMMSKLENSFESSMDLYDHTLEPTLEDYIVVMKAWSRSDDKNSPDKAQTILNLMESVYKKGVAMIQPDETCYRYLLQTAAHRPNGTHLGQLVDSTLARMRAHYMVPDTKCFAAAIRTWKNVAVHKAKMPLADRERSVRRAMELLSEMETSDYQSSNVSVQISTELINDVLEALTASRNPKRMKQAEELLTRMEESLAQDKTSKIPPNVDSYIQVLRVWGTHESIEKVAKAKVILFRMQEHLTAVSFQHNKNQTFSVDVFNEYIRVCGSYVAPSDKEGMQVFREALATIAMMKNEGNLRPNSGTYTALLDASGELITGAKERQVVVEKIFTLCCNDGMVDGKVLEHMREVASEEQYSKLVVAFSKDVEGTKVVPEKWTVNALGGSGTNGESRIRTQLSIDGTLAVTASLSEYKMRRLRSKRNKNLLQGGRLKKPERKTPWRLHDPAQISEL